MPAPVPHSTPSGPLPRPGARGRPPPRPPDRPTDLPLREGRGHSIAGVPGPQHGSAHAPQPMSPFHPAAAPGEPGLTACACRAGDPYAEGAPRHGRQKILASSSRDHGDHGCAGANGPGLPRAWCYRWRCEVVRGASWEEQPCLVWCFSGHSDYLTHGDASHAVPWRSRLSVGLSYPSACLAVGRCRVLTVYLSRAPFFGLPFLWYA